jgi:phosphate transport system protein
MSHNLRTTFDREFGLINDDILTMSQLVEAAIERAMNALMDRDTNLAREVITGDAQVNQLRFKIEEACLALIATQQPAARDLRAVMTASFMVVEIERIADYAAGIGKTVLLMEEEPLLKTIKKIPRMGNLAREMFRECIQAYVQRDTEWARRIANQDEEMDQLYHSVFEKLVETMSKKPEMVTRATYLMWCAHNLERIADRVTNIAERIIFITTGDLQEFK